VRTKQEQAMKAFALQLDRVSKVFGDFRALNNIDLRVVAGSIHAILGENGAGKTTLMNILYGLYQPDGGSITLNGQPAVIPSPSAAMEMGIGMIHQHFMLVDTLTVVENVVLGLPGQGLQLSLAEHAARLTELSQTYGFDIDPHVEIWKLPIGMRQRVEILKVLYRQANIIILDEPTSVLAPNEVASFLEGLKRLRDAGKTVIFITHKLDEVAEVADRITVMRLGQVTAETEVASITTRDMARMMVGRDVVLTAFEKPDNPPGSLMVVARNLSAIDNRGIQALKDVSFEIRSGEILGVAGVDGNGQAELAEVLTGMRAPSAGSLAVDGEDITALSVYDRRHRIGLSYVPEDRHHTGLVLDFSVMKNAMLRDFRVAPFSKKGVLDMRRAREVTDAWVKQFDVRLRSVDQAVRFLSGGNQQKLIFAREVECRPRVMVVMQPCKGLDVGAIEVLQRAILRERQRGTAILYISTELEHILNVCDRVAVMCAGRITGILRPQDATDARVGALMGGISEAESA
jgi:ABC-type uncharacterized transport system ATPase subunit